MKPTQDEIVRAYYMKSRTLILHEQIVWGEGDKEELPVIPIQAQDKDKKRDDKEATIKDGEEEQPPETEEQRAAREAQEKIKRLEQHLREARDAAAKAAEDKAKKAGEDLIKELDDEKAKKERQKEKRKEKKQRKKQSKEGEVPPSDEGEDSDEEEEEKKEKPEGESKKPDGESKEEGDKPTTEEKKPEDKEKSKEKPKPEGEEAKEKSEEGPPKDKEPEDSWAEVLRKARKPRQVTSKAAEKAKARSYPRPMCEPSAKPNYTYPRPHHVPTREVMYSGKWIVNEKPRDVQKRNPLKLTKEHAAIWELGVRSRYTDNKVCVLQAMNAKKQTPPRGTPSTSQGPDTYWVQTAILLQEDGSLPFSELPGMYPRLYTFDKFWDIPRRPEGRQLEGVALGVAQHVVGTFELDMKRRAATVKAYVDNEPLMILVEYGGF